MELGKHHVDYICKAVKPLIDRVRVHTCGPTDYGRIHSITVEGVTKKEREVIRYGQEISPDRKLESKGPLAALDEEVKRFSERAFKSMKATIEKEWL